MKLSRFILAIATGLILAGGALFAQMPRTFSYQGVLMDGSGEPISNGSHSITISLYDSPSGGSALFSETQTVTTGDGIFSMVIGSSTAIPGSLDFKSGYWLGVSVDGGAELTPRTPLTSVPYAVSADHAATAGTASALAPGATGVVTSINGQSGAVTLQGGGGTTITQNGSTITISSVAGAGGSGIQGVQNTDGTLGITSSTGPVATINMNDNSVTGAKIADGAVQGADIADNAIGSIEIANGAVGNDDIAGGAVTADKIADGAIGTDALRNNAVTSAKLADESVGSDKLANTSVTTEKIADGGVGTVDIADDAVTSAKIAAGGVQNADLADNSVTGTKVADNAVTETKIADNAVSTNKLANGAVTLGKISAAGAANGKVLEYNGSAIVWGTDDGFSLPTTATANTANDALSLTNNGAGNVLFVNSNDASSTNSAIYARSKGIGPTIYVSKTGTSGSNAAMVVQSSAGTGLFVREDGESQAAIFRIYNAASTSVALEVSTPGSGAATYSFNTGTGRAGYFAINNSANTTDALYATTNGTGHAIYSAGSAYKTVGGNTWTIPSDARLKQDVLPFTDGLSVIDQIRPVRYHYNGLAGTQTEREEYGVLAQEIGAIAPYTVEARTVAVDPNEPAKGSMDILTYNSGPLTYVMINAIKELNTKINAMGTATSSQSGHGLDAAELAGLREENRLLRLEMEEMRRQLHEIMTHLGK